MRADLSRAEPSVVRPVPLAHTRAVFLLFVAAVPYEYLIYTPAGPISKVAGALVFAFLGAEMVLDRRRRISLPAGAAAILALLGLGLVSLLWTADFARGVRLWLTVMQSAAAWVIGCNVLTTVRYLRRAVTIFMLAVAGLACFSLYSGSIVFNRLVATADQPINLFGNTLAAGMLAAIYLLVSAQSRRLARMAASLSLILCGVAIVGSGSRGSVAGLIVGSLPLVLIRRRGSSTLAMYAVVGSVMLWVSGISVEQWIPNQGLSRLGVGSQVRLMEHENRLEIIGSVAGLSLGEVLRGLGLGSADAFIAEANQLTYVTPQVSPHSNLLRWLLDVGIIGVFAYLSLFWRMTRPCWRRFRAGSVECALGLGFLAQMFLQGQFSEVQFSKTFWIALVFASAGARSAADHAPAADAGSVPTIPLRGSNAPRRSEDRPVQRVAAGHRR